MSNYIPDGPCCGRSARNKNNLLGSSSWPMMLVVFVVNDTLRRRPSAGGEEGLYKEVRREKDEAMEIIGTMIGSAGGLGPGTLPGFVKPFPHSQRLNTMYLFLLLLLYSVRPRKVLLDWSSFSLSVLSIDTSRLKDC